MHVASPLPQTGEAETAASTAGETRKGVLTELCAALRPGQCPRPPDPLRRCCWGRCLPSMPPPLLRLGAGQHTCRCGRGDGWSTRAGGAAAAHRRQTPVLLALTAARRQGATQHGLLSWGWSCAHHQHTFEVPTSTQAIWDQPSSHPGPKQEPHGPTPQPPAAKPLPPAPTPQQPLTGTHLPRLLHRQPPQGTAPPSAAAPPPPRAPHRRMRPPPRRGAPQQRPERRLRG
jgi:hypothetical protein